VSSPPPRVAVCRVRHIYDVGTRKKTDS
jgi:hypothetical protein